MLRATTIRCQCSGRVSSSRAQVIRQKQALLRTYAPLLQYPYPKLSDEYPGAGDDSVAAGQGAVPWQTAPPNAVILALERLSADIAAG